MFRRILDKLKDALFTPDCVVLERQGSEFVVAAYHGEQPIPFAKLASRSPVLSHLQEKLPAHGAGLLVSPKVLPDVRQLLQRMGPDVRFQVEIADEVVNVNPCPPPSDLQVKFDWHGNSGKLLPCVSHGAEYLGRGWFLAQDRCWRIEGVTSDDEAWLRRPYIAGEDILRLLVKKLPEWTKRRLPFSCDLTYYSLPALVVTVRQVAETRVILDVDWRVDPQGIAEIPSLPGYVCSGQTIMRGVTPKQAAPLPPRSGLASLEGQQIPAFFSDTLPRIKPLLRGAMEEFIKQHKVIAGQGELSLGMRREPTDGVGKPAAVTIFSCGGYPYYAEKLSQRIQEGVQFIRVRRGWLPVDSLRKARIGANGNTIDGLSLASVPLTAAEVLRRGSPRINGPWSRFEIPKELALPAGEAKSCARKHLEFLMEWRIPGGIVDQAHQYADAFRDAISALLTRAPQANVLVIGEKAALTIFAGAPGALPHTRYDGSKDGPPPAAQVKGLVLATPSVVSESYALSQADWTLLCLLEADDLIKSSSSGFFEQLVQYKKRLVVGSFLNREFLARNAKRQAITRVWGLGTEAEADLVWKYGLRDPRQPPEPLPPAYTLGATRPSARTIQPADMVVTDLPQSEAMPIPPRPAAPSREEKVTFPSWDKAGIEPSVAPREPEPARVGTPEEPPRWKREPKFTFPAGDVGVSVGGGGIHDPYRDMAHRFTTDALRYVARREKSASFVPFMCYLPTYDSMTTDQRKWYFYWRGQVREGQYPETDLSYIFVHVYELINNVGVKDGVDGYTQLFKLWTAYRRKYPKLDRYLMDWIADYLVVNKAAVDLPTFYSQAMEMKAFAGDPDILLSRYAKGSLDSLPMDLIDRLSDYRPRKSKFYNDGNSALMDYCLPLSVGRVDACLRHKKGKGILQSYHPDTATLTRRFAFRSAFFAGKAREIELPPVVPFSQHPPLREFITGVVKHAENDLRALKSCKSKLRGYSLDDDVKAAIDAFIAEAQGKVAGARVAPRVVIDLTKVSQLTAESDEVRAMLLAGQEQEAELASVVPTCAKPADATSGQSVERPTDTPAGLLTDLDPVSRILSQLSSEERQLLDVLRRFEWEASDVILAESMPTAFVEALADRINNLALDQLPDVLVLSEVGKKVVAEDFRDELEFLLSRGASTQPKPGAAKLASDLPADWAEFIEKLADYQIHVLRAILQHQDPSEEIRRLAAEHATMPETLIEQINELASRILGDVVIAPGSSPPVIEEEDMQMVEKVTQLSQ